MSYIEQNFKDGQTLTAEMLNKIEQGIVNNENSIENIQLTPGPKGDKGDTGDQGPKGDKGEPGPEIIFDDVLTSIDCGGITAGTSLKDKSLTDVLILLLGIQEPPKTAVEIIMENSIPAYVGLTGSTSNAVTYCLLNTANATYTEQGFYNTISGDEITNAGYQIVFDGNNDAIAQTFAIPANATIITAYQYQPAMNQWLEIGFDGTHWVNSGNVTYTVNGEEIEYTTYSYNVSAMGDAITATEYWRFELEV